MIPTRSEDVGLTKAEAERRLGIEGPNSLPDRGRRGLPKIVLSTIREPMLALLLIGGAAYLLLGDRLEAMLLLAFATFSVVITIWQNYRTERLLITLRDLAAPRAMVVRDGDPCRIAGADIVRGDLLLVERGDRIAADADIVAADGLEVDESLLTGEAMAIPKRLSVGPASDDGQRLFGGTLVVGGTARAVVTATGGASAVGRIGAAVASVEEPAPPLVVETRFLVQLCGVGAALVALTVVILFGLFRGGWIEALLAGIAIGMAMIPEEFPVVLTIFLAVGAWRIAQVGVLARRAAAIEALGAATILCADKTGTLTENRMAVAGYWRNDEIASVSDPILLRAAIGASPPFPIDPMEVAFHEAGQRVPEVIGGLASSLLLKTFPLRESCLAMGNVWATADGAKRQLYVKGAPESVMTLCNLAEGDRLLWRQAIEAMAGQGMRVLGLAEATLPSDALPDALADIPVKALGLIGLSDPVRAAVPAAIAACRQAAIRVMMITGDHVATARHIGNSAGLADGTVLTGTEIDQLTDEALSRRLGNVTIVARVRPEQKLRIVEALKTQGEIVAMTGDGVNDAPALKAAHIGIAMGRRGTDVAREAAALVLLDDDFSAIVTSVALGRRIYDNIRKAMDFIFAVHVPIAALALLPLATGLPVLLSPLHIALLEMVIDPACALVFEVEAPEPDVMRRPPRNPHQRLFSMRRVRWSVGQGVFAACVLMAVAGILSAIDVEETRLRSILFFALIATVMALIFANRRPTSLGAALANRPFGLLTAGIGAFAILCLMTEPLRHLLGLDGLRSVDLLTATLVGLTIYGMIELVRRAAGRIRPRTVVRAASSDRRY